MLLYQAGGKSCTAVLGNNNNDDATMTAVVYCVSIHLYLIFSIFLIGGSASAVEIAGFSSLDNLVYSQIWAPRMVWMLDYPDVLLHNLLECWATKLVAQNVPVLRSTENTCGTEVA